MPGCRVAKKISILTTTSLLRLGFFLRLASELIFLKNGDSLLLQPFCIVLKRTAVPCLDDYSLNLPTISLRFSASLDNSRALSLMCLLPVVISSAD